MPTGPDREVVITATEDVRSDLEGLAKRLSAKGLKNATTLPGIGIITGRASPDMLEGMKGEPGVSSVEAAGGVQIPPPGSDVQ